MYMSDHLQDCNTTNHARKKAHACSSVKYLDPFFISRDKYYSTRHGVIELPKIIPYNIQYHTQKQNKRW